jgi:5'-nucleotidase
MKKTIAVDLDSTLNNLDKVWIARYNEDYGDNLTVSDMVRWDVTTYVKPECGAKMLDYLVEPGFFANLEIRYCAREVMEYLQSFYNVYIVTAYTPETCADKAKWVTRHLPNFDLKKLVFLNDKWMFNADYLVDDGGHNVEAFKGESLLFDSPCPWNHYLGDKFPRAKDWIAVYKWFKTREGEHEPIH